MSTRNEVKSYVLSQTGLLNVQQVGRGLWYSTGLKLSDSQVWRHLVALVRSGDLTRTTVGGGFKYGKPASVETMSFSSYGQNRLAGT